MFPIKNRFFHVLYYGACIATIVAVILFCFSEHGVLFAMGIATVGVQFCCMLGAFLAWLERKLDDVKIDREWDNH